MSDADDHGTMLRMPVHFGPATGPRRGPDDKRFDWTGVPTRLALLTQFRTDTAALAAILPPGFSPDGEPIVTVEVQYLSGLHWLGGRGYNTLGVRFPAVYRGAKETRGMFLSVLWENLADPIITGREELGFNKVYCEIPPHRSLAGRRMVEASWLGHQFFRLDLQQAEQVDPATLSQAELGGWGAGTLHYKYIPRTGEWGKADAAYAVLSQSSGSTTKITEAWRARGQHEFLESKWEQLPTLYRIVNALAALPMRERLDGLVSKSHGGKDFADQRRLD
jgi:hypothetical protein